jgi:hypothetical protein
MHAAYSPAHPHTAPLDLFNTPCDLHVHTRIPILQQP